MSCALQYDFALIFLTKRERKTGCCFLFNAFERQAQCTCNSCMDLCMYVKQDAYFSLLAVQHGHNVVTLSNKQPILSATEDFLKVEPLMRPNKGPLENCITERTLIERAVCSFH